MFAVGRLGSYISRGVYTVSGPFHPFGGAVDIIVVEQQDGSFKSTPWYVRFGKFQGVLKATERVVRINVNGVDTDFHMYLDNKGEAFFLREVDAAEGETESCSLSGDEMEGKSDIWRTKKSMSCNYDASRTNMVSELEGSNRKVLTRANSRRERILGLPIGRRSMKENGFQDGEASVEADRVRSLERAEIAADLLEVRWTTNLRTVKNHNAGVSDENKENMSKCDRGDETSRTTAEAHLADEVVAYPRSIIGEAFIGDSAVNKDVEEVPFESSGAAEHCESVEDLSVGARNLNLLPLVSEEENSIAKLRKSTVSSSAQHFSGDPTPEGNDKVTPSDNFKEEQFFFSDLDDQNLEHNQTTSSGSEKCLSEDSLEGRENEVSELLDESNQVKCMLTQDKLLISHPSLSMNSNRVSSAISISKAHNSVDEEALTPVAESLPNMMLGGDDLSLNAPHPLGRSLDSTLEAFMMVNNDVASGFSGGQTQVALSPLTTDSSDISEEIKKIISDPAVEVSLCRHLLSEGMGYEAAARAFDAEKLDMDNFLLLGADIMKNDKLVVRIGGLYFPWDAALPIASAIGSQQTGEMLEPEGMIAVGQVEFKTNEGTAQKSVNSRNGSWKIWPFSLKRSDSIQSRNSSSEADPESPKQMHGTPDAVVPKVAKKKLRAKFPTSEQLASLNLKEGKNVVTFTFSTAMLGEQQVEARIFLWKWNARIVISDVDGTITKSDVLGQFMPLMGIDWSQTGVTHLFSAIKENGYQLLFLSARSISQAYHTRQFLFNLKQDGKALPEGPVLISPDGLFPSLYREVIRRAPHEFKISCLEDVKVLFPLDHNPFYAGFGNRDTDEFSYLKVGIPRGKIFTINPKGQVVVNRRVDSKSYTSLHTLVHDMFPPTTLHEQEDYNSWNFWRLPPPDALI
ncbi:phosphatidate phosphatase PAH2 isoform X3 [Beta vulgaris subsp. vulgaris]|uniref:phosphatidate phosphatase PAH2 isoform X3 n=1 Tax=Beta vulgaris subsp. vulgaris TaxID=3555 RepID=UPI002037216C|nr:phosphatidate phosphatase PAH2 isoform X3 [Beta vulgaris subsp. vulgaris]